MQTTNKKRRGKRAGRATHDKELRDIHSRLSDRPRGGIAVHHPGKSNFTATVTDNAIFYDGLPCSETVETHVVPRQSLSRKQLLRVFPQQVEFEEIPTKQLVLDGKAVPNPLPFNKHRVVWKSDKSLLNRIPTDKIGTFKREGSVSVGLSKRRLIRTENEDLPLDFENKTNSLTLTDVRDWERHEEVRIAVCKYLNGGVTAPDGWIINHPLFHAVAEWWMMERERLNKLFSL